MKINKLVLKNFLSAQHSVFDLPSVTTLICGRNGSGKSQVHDALRIALLPTAPNARGVNAKSKLKTLMTDGAKDGYVEATVDGNVYKRHLKTGNYSTQQPELNEFLPFLLHTKQFGSLTPEARRRFLLDLGGVTVDKDSIVTELLKRGCDKTCVEDVAPLLLTGFETAQKHAKDGARSSKGAWEAVTGEKWGSTKGEKWVSAGFILPDDHAMQLTAVEKDIVDLTVKAEYHGGVTAPCPCCGESITYEAGQFHKSQKLDHDPVQAQADLHQAKELRRKLEHQQFQSENEQKITGQAQECHEEITNWLLLADELSPEGVPRMVFDLAVKPIVERLAHWSNFFPMVSIDPYAEVTFDGRVYELCSESQQWICDAMIAESIAYRSGLRLLLLDRMDVLDIPNRGLFIQWLQHLQNDYDTIIVTATLETAPALPFCDSVWIENGSPVQSGTGAT